MKMIKLVLLFLSVQVFTSNVSWATDLKPQEIIFKTSDRLILTDSPSRINAISSSGLKVEILSSSPTVCDVVDSLLRLKSEGNCILVASQTGDRFFSPAQEITRTIRIQNQLSSEQLIVPKIVGGVSIPISDAPWQVGLIYSNATSNYEGQFCGGSIINSSWILTAAHCVVTNNAVDSINSFRILAGTADLSKTSLTDLKSVNRIVVHPNYNSNSNDFDIALIKLAQPLNFIPNTIQSISINQSEIAPGKDALISGWGATNYKSPWGVPSGYADQLEGGYVDIDSSTTCAFYEISFNSQTMLCASTPGFWVDTCQGDSGGPLAIFESGQWRLAGITSFGDGCGWESPGYYAKVSGFSEWIYSYIRTAQSPLSISNATRSVAINTAVTLTTSGGSGTGAVSFNISGANCSPSGVGNSQLTASTATTCSVTATKASDATYGSATSAAVTFTFLGAQSPLTISNTTTTNPVETRITLTTSGGSGTGATTYRLSPANFNCTLSSRSGATTLTARNATTCTVIATKAASTGFLVASSASKSFIFSTSAVAQAPLTIANTTLTGTVGTPITLSTSGGSGSGAVTYATTGTGCSISTASLSASAATTCVVTATKAASTGFLVASSASKSFIFSTSAVAQAPLTFANTTLTGTVGTPITLSTSGGSGTGAVTYATTGTGCSISTASLSASAATTCVVTATKAASTGFLVASSASKSFIFSTAAVAQAPLTISNTTTTNPVGTRITLTTTGGSGTGAITYRLSPANFNCTLSSRNGATTLTARNATTCTVIATKAASTGFLVASSASKSFNFTARP